MTDEREQESGHEPEMEKTAADERVLVPTAEIEDLDATEQDEDVKGGFRQSY